MFSGIGEFIIICMLILLGVVAALLIRQIRIMIKEDKAYKAFLEELRNES